jgi:hypothetical protein
MLTLVSRSGDVIEQLGKDEHLTGSLVLIVVGVLFALVIRDYLAAAVRPPAPPVLFPPVRLNGRLHLQRSGARRRAWTTAYSRSRPRRATVVEWVGTARPSPAIKRFRARRSLRHLTRDWAVVRYPR